MNGWLVSTGVIHLQVIIESLWFGVSSSGPSYRYTLARSCRKVPTSYRWKTNISWFAASEWNLLIIEITEGFYCEELKGNAVFIHRTNCTGYNGCELTELALIVFVSFLQVMW